MLNRKRIVAIFIVALTLIGILSSVIFIAENYDHDCCECDCVVCAQIKTNIESFAFNISKTSVACVIVLMMWALVIVAELNKIKETKVNLVSLKIKLSD